MVPYFPPKFQTHSTCTGIRQVKLLHHRPPVPSQIHLDSLPQPSTITATIVTLVRHLPTRTLKNGHIHQHQHQRHNHHTSPPPSATCTSPSSPHPTPNSPPRSPPTSTPPTPKPPTATPPPTPNCAQHLHKVRNITRSIEIEVPFLITEGHRIADRHVVKIENIDGSGVEMEVFLVGERDGEGKFERVWGVTRQVSGEGDGSELERIR